MRPPSSARRLPRGSDRTWRTRAFVSSCKCSSEADVVHERPRPPERRRGHRAAAVGNRRFRAVRRRRLALDRRRSPTRGGGERRRISSPARAVALERSTRADGGGGAACGSVDAARLGSRHHGRSGGRRLDRQHPVHAGTSATGQDRDAECRPAVAAGPAGDHRILAWTRRSTSRVHSAAAALAPTGGATIHAVEMPASRRNRRTAEGARTRGLDGHDAARLARSTRVQALPAVTHRDACGGDGGAGRRLAAGRRRASRLSTTSGSPATGSDRADSCRTPALPARVGCGGRDRRRHERRRDTGESRTRSERLEIWIGRDECPRSVSRLATADSNSHTVACEAATQEILNDAQAARLSRRGTVTGFAAVVLAGYSLHPSSPCRR